MWITLMIASGVLNSVGAVCVGCWLKRLERKCHADNLELWRHLATVAQNGATFSGATLNSLSAMQCEIDMISGMIQKASADPRRFVVSETRH